MYLLRKYLLTTLFLIRLQLEKRPLFYMLIRATWRSSHLQGKGWPVLEHGIWFNVTLFFPLYSFLAAVWVTQPNGSSYKKTSSLIYNFICEITKLSWQRSVRIITKMAAKLQNVTNEDGIKRCFRIPKHMKEHIRKDSIRYFVENVWKLWT